MKWFKHLAGSLKDSIIFEAVTKFQGDGYLVFFGTLELMADEFDIYHPDTVTIPIKKMTSFFQLSRQKTLKILAFFDEKAKMFQRENKSFFAEINNTHVTIICKRFAALADNHTTNELAKANKLLVSDKQVTSPQDIKKEDNTDIKKKIKEKKQVTASVTLPLEIDEQIWKDFVDMRKTIKAPLTERAKKEILADLEKLGQDKNEVLKQSIKNSWRGVFELRSQKDKEYFV